MRLQPHVALAVLLHVILQWESPVADVAQEGFFLRVACLVLVEVGDIGKGSAADVTLMRFLACVKSSVPYQVPRGVK